MHWLKCCVVCVNLTSAPQRLTRPSEAVAAAIVPLTVAVATAPVAVAVATIPLPWPRTTLNGPKSHRIPDFRKQMWYSLG